MSEEAVVGFGYTDKKLSEEELKSVVFEALDSWDLKGQRVLALIPDSTRTSPTPRIFRLFHQVLHGRVKALDFMVALGTHPLMSEEALNRLVGVSAEERNERYRGTGLFNHRWDLPETFTAIGMIPRQETEAFSKGMLSMEVPVQVNKMLLDYDHLILCGPVYPHEVVGFSGGNKYLFPGVSGRELINFTHWLGALITSLTNSGVKHTPVRLIIDKAATFVDRPKHCFSLVTGEQGLAGVYAGDPLSAWSRAVDLSARTHIKYVDRPYYQALAVMPTLFDDLWTGAKGMYKLEPVIADGGEVIIYAPHIDEISYTHGNLIDQVGYHVRDYFVKQWEHFKDYPWGILAHSTYLRGAGTYEAGVESARIRVTLATGISRERCERVGLGYRDPASIRLEEWAGREEEGILLVPQAGETLYRLKDAEKVHEQSPTAAG